MTFAQGLNVEESENVLRFKEFEGWYVTYDKERVLAGNCGRKKRGRERRRAPLMILQNIQAAEDIFVAMRE